MRAVIEELSWHDVATIVAIGPVRNASVTRFEAGPSGLRLTAYNAVDHLS
jgi:hypothetical protein